MIDRWLASIIFGVLGFVSFVVWSYIDEFLCGVYINLCKPPPGVCIGIDHCSPDARMLIGLIFVLLVPPILFAILGYFLSKRRVSVRCLIFVFFAAVAMHWTLTFVGTRIFAL